MKAWNRFWHESVSPAALGAFRVLFAYCLWREVRTTRARSVGAIDDGLYSLPYAEWIPEMSEAVYHFVHDAQYPIILALGLGLFTRSCSLTLLLLQGWVYFADQLSFRNHPYFFLLVLLLLVLSPAGEGFSLGAWLHDRSDGRSLRSRLFGEARPATAQRLIQVQVCLVYFLAALQKLHPHYLDGSVIYDKLASELIQGQSRELFLEHARWLPGYLQGSNWPWPTMAAATVVLELLLPIGLWFKRPRRVLMVMGLGFHASIALLMDIRVFSFAMMASYLLFLEPDTVPRACERLGSSLQAAWRRMSGRPA